MPMKATVTHLEHITEHVFELMLKPAAPLRYEPGQWLSLGLPVGPKPPTKRVYSMASPMRADHQLQLIFDHVHDGIGSTYLAGLKPGDQVEIINSMGNFILPDERPNHLLFIARYTGLVPVFSILKQLEAEAFSGRVHLIYSSPNVSERFYESELRALKLSALSMDFIDLEKTEGETPEALRAIEYAAEFDKASLFSMVCGVGEMVKPTRKQLKEAGFIRTQIRGERFN